MGNPEIVVETRGLGKRYGRRWAVRDLPLQVMRGDVFGFLGPNGAGKSTTIRMLLSLIRPTTGDVHLFGHALRTDRRRALASVGGIVEKPDFYSYLTAVRNLEVVGALYGGVRRNRIMEVLELVGLRDRAFDPVKAYSHGMKQRLGIAQALLADPQLVILDEPTNGLDPQGMKEIRDLILHLSRDRGKTILLSSHLLNEIEQVATRMAIIHNGSMVVQGGVADLLAQGESTVHIQAEPAAKVDRVLRSQKTIVKASERVRDEVRVSIARKDIPPLQAAFVKAGVRVYAVVPHRSLEDYFLSITEHAGKGS